jgi:hypothetical protein
MDLEAAKTATVDSMAMEKQRVIDSMQVEMAKVETEGNYNSQSAGK